MSHIVRHDLPDGSATLHVECQCGWVSNRFLSFAEFDREAARAGANRQALRHAEVATVLGVDRLWQVTGAYR